MTKYSTSHSSQHHHAPFRPPLGVRTKKILSLSQGRLAPTRAKLTSSHTAAVVVMKMRAESRNRRLYQMPAIRWSSTHGTYAQGHKRPGVDPQTKYGQAIGAEDDPQVKTRLQTLGLLRLVEIHQLDHPQVIEGANH